MANDHMLELKNRKVLVVGLGKSGLACARFLHHRNARVRATDCADARLLQSELQMLDRLGIKATVGRHREADFADAELIVLSPGVPHTLAPVTTAAARGIPVIGEIELAAGFIGEPILAVTGTNGKTTTTMLLGAMLEKSGLTSWVGGNIGNPLIAFADERPKAERVVVEVSSFQLDTIQTFRPQVAVLLNISADHLDRYPDMGAYAESKARIFRNQLPDDIAVLNGADRRVNAIGARLKTIRLFFDPPDGREGARITDDRLEVRCRWVDARGTTVSLAHDFDFARYRLPGRHNRENAAAACLAALAGGAAPPGVQAALDTFIAPPHRMSWVAVIDGVDYYDDSKATNTDAVIRAVETFRRPVVLILGGRDKGGDWDALHGQLRKRVKKVIAMGEAAAVITDRLGRDVNVESVPGMAEAVPRAAQAACSGDVVLLAPGCASFDSYRNYAERGEDFMRRVKRMETAHERA